MNENLIIMEHMEQGSQEWLDARIGVITASPMQRLLTGGSGATRDAYILEVVSEILTGVPAEKIKTLDMIRGNLLEGHAIDAYSAVTGHKVRRVGIMYLDACKRIAASPDGLVMDGDRIVRGVEVKCPQPKAHMATIAAMNSPKKYEAQLQSSMRVSGADHWDFVSFCPEFKHHPLVIISRARDEDYIAKIVEATTLGIKQIDEHVNAARAVQTHHAVEAIRLDALELIDIMSNREPEFN